MKPGKKFWTRFGVVLVATSLLTINGTTRSVIAAVVNDPASLLSARSPGARGAGALSQTKERLKVPEEFTQKMVVTPDPVLPAGDIIIPKSYEDTGIAFVPLAAIPSAESLGLIPGTSTVPTGRSGGGGGGGGGGGCCFVGIPGDPDKPTDPETPTTPVPEPSSWIMMVTGLALLGATLRKRKLVPAI